MALVEQLIINGLVTGGVYVLVAIGLTIVFGVLGIVNFAHGEFYMLGGYFALVLITVSGLPFFAVLPLAMLGGALIGVVAEMSAGIMIAGLLGPIGAHAIFVRRGLPRRARKEAQSFDASPEVAE